MHFGFFDSLVSQTPFKMEQNNLNQTSPLPPPRAHTPQRPCFIRISEHEHLVLPLHTVPQLFINPQHLPRVFVDLQQEYTPRRGNTQFRLRILPMAMDPQIFPNNLHNPNSMKILAWNCRGIARSNFLAAIRALIDRHQPQVLILMNTRHLDDEPESFSPVIRQQLPFSGSFLAQVGGFWVLWSNEPLIVSSFTGSTCTVSLEAILPPQLPVQDLEM